jgi:hypothetical protein
MEDGEEKTPATVDTSSPHGSIKMATLDDATIDDAEDDTAVQPSQPAASQTATSDPIISSSDATARKLWHDSTTSNLLDGDFTGWADLQSPPTISVVQADVLPTQGTHWVNLSTLTSLLIADSARSQGQATKALKYVHALFGLASEPVALLGIVIPYLIGVQACADLLSKALASYA